MRRRLNRRPVCGIVMILAALFAAGCDRSGADAPIETRGKDRAMAPQLKYLNPEGLHRNPAYSQAVVVPGGAVTIYIGGQNAVDEKGAIVGKGDIAAQAERIFKNLELALKAAGAGLENVVKWNVYVVSGQPLQPGFEAFRRAWGDRPNPPVITGVFVAGLAHPDFLMELEAIAVLPGE